MDKDETNYFFRGKPTLNMIKVMGKKRQASLHLHFHFSLTHLLLKLYSWAPGRNTSNSVRLKNEIKKKQF